MAQKTFSKITPQIYRMDLAMGRGSIAVFLVESGTGWILIDTGLEQHAPLLVGAVLDQTGGVKPSTLILTHGHPDHAANAVRLRKEFRLKVAAGRDEIRYLTEPVFYRKIPTRSILNRPLYYLAGLFTQPAMLGRGVDMPLDERMLLGGMEVFHVPGHAPGMVALLHRADRALLCADVFSNTGNRLHDPSSLFTYDPQLNRTSQAKLAALDFDHLLPSHGPPIMNDGRGKVVAYVEKRLGRPVATAAGTMPAASR
jgi:glyoxylase-like metal-dependent hydrolase (beta-lactamase superfamily II)